MSLSVEQSIYRIQRAPTVPHGPMDPAGWRWADAAELSHFHAQSSDHRPRTTARVMYRGRELFVLFSVRDRYVRCVNTQYQSSVCCDSCVEFFVWPKGAGGYFNFEVNCGGTMLLMFIEDATPVNGEFARFTPVSEADARRITIHHTLPQRLEREIEEWTEWRLAMRIPLEVLERYAGPIGELSGQEWRGNFFKCADHSSHPHWASWSPINGTLNFHQPEFFGVLRFE